MLLAAGYFDESTDGKFEDKVFTVGGYVLSGYPAVSLDLRWKDLLEKYELPYFKASELEGGIGQFAKFRDDPETAPKAGFTARERELFTVIKTEFVDLLCNETDLVGVSATVQMQDWKRFAIDRPEMSRKLPSVFNLCAQLVVMESGLLMARTNRQNGPNLRGMLRPVFDAHKQYEAMFTSAFGMFKSKNPNATRLILPPIFEDERNYRCLQAADLFVYEVRRTVSNYFFDSRRDLRKAMARLFPQIAKTYVLTYDALKLLAEWQSDGIPVDPIEDELD